MNFLPFAFVAIVLGTVPACSLRDEARTDNCTKKEEMGVCEDAVVKERVDWACKLVEEKGKGAMAQIQIMRYECCNEPNYVWINDLQPKMVMHPIKTTLNGKVLTESKDSQGKKLFVEFVNAVNQSPSGAWVDYTWPKFGEEISTPKKSWVKKCKVGNTPEHWVVGSGTWK